MSSRIQTKQEFEEKYPVLDPVDPDQLELDLDS